jgi:uncharacterized protein (TIGR04255 family)
MKEKEKYGDKQYKKNFLTSVIARIDMVSPHSSLKNEIPKEMSNIALNYFPISEPKSAFAQEFTIERSKFSTNKEDFIEWNFFGENREKRLMVNQNSFFVNYQEYENYQTLYKEFIEFSQNFFLVFPDAQPKRLGLRYINEIDAKGVNPLNWDNEINKKLLCLLRLNYPDSHPIRIFHNYEIKCTDYKLRFQFGIHNPDYPAAIIRRRFILDYDAYYEGLIEPSEIPQYLNKFHSKIQELFEDSITDKLREVMDGTEQ